MPRRRRRRAANCDDDDDVPADGNNEKALFQFGCPKCKGGTFWKKRPVSNPARPCGKCGEKLNPIAKEDMVGLGKFTCACGRFFTNGKAKWDVAQPCYGCGAKVKCSDLGPRFRRGKRKTKNKHSCDVCHTGECDNIPVSIIASK